MKTTKILEAVIPFICHMIVCLVIMFATLPIAVIAFLCLVKGYILMSAVLYVFFLLIVDCLIIVIQKHKEKSIKKTFFLPREWISIESLFVRSVMALGIVSAILLIVWYDPGIQYVIHYLS